MDSIEVGGDGDQLTLSSPLLLARCSCPQLTTQLRNSLPHFSEFRLFFGLILVGGGWHEVGAQGMDSGFDLLIGSLFLKLIHRYLMPVFSDIGQEIGVLFVGLGVLGAHGE